MYKVVRHDHDNASCVLLTKEEEKIYYGRERSCWLINLLICEQNSPVKTAFFAVVFESLSADYYELIIKSPLKQSNPADVNENKKRFLRQNFHLQRIENGSSASLSNY